MPGARPYVVRGSESVEERGGSFIHAHPADDDDDDDDRVGGGCVAIGGDCCRRRCCRGKREKGSKRRRSPQREARGRDGTGTETEALVAASTGCGSASSSLFLSLLNYISLKACKAFEQSTTKGDVNLVPRTQEMFLGEF